MIHHIFAAIFVIPCIVTATLGLDVKKTLSFDEGYSPLFGGGNVVPSDDGRSVRLLLDRYTGSGFISSDYYYHGIFSASIKLPSDYTAGVVVAFYMSNGDVFEKTHDELDFEFLGNIRGKPWRVQTNVYGNGSTARGREERYILPFNPTTQAHHYSILWTLDTTIFYIDDTPIREVVRTNAMSSDYPSKPMSLYATIWDGSAWATAGGKYKADYNYAPFTAEFSDLVLNGHRTDPTQQLPTAPAVASPDTNSAMTQKERAAMHRFRERYMSYCFCYDRLRYPVTLPDCNVMPSEQRRFEESGHVEFEAPRKRHSKRRSREQRARRPWQRSRHVKWG